MVLQSKKIFFFFILSLIVCRYNLMAQASFTAKISPATIGKNEITELRLMVDNARKVDNIVPPSLDDFIIISGPNQESGMESNNGVTRQYIGLTYQLKPKSTGKFTIPSAFATADGKTLKSNRVTLQVTRNSQGASQGNGSSPFGNMSLFPEVEPRSAFNDFIIKKGENLSEKINKNIFIKVDVNKLSCFVGEPLVVTYKLYTRLKSESNITKNPSFNGFSVIDLLPPGNTYYSMEKLNGREYNVYILRKSQLYPLQAGTVELESTEVENNIHFIKEEYANRQVFGIDDIFRDFAQTAIPPEGIQDEKVTLLSKPVLINVKALPEKDKLLSFKGAVGKFNIESNIEKNNFTTDDAGKLTVSISGEGNMSMIIAPDIAWPAGIEPYEPTTKEQLNKRMVPVSGIKEFEYPFTVSKEGVYNIPAISYSYFDVKGGKYKTAQTKPLAIVVAKGAGKKQPLLNGKAVSEREKFSDTLFTNRWLIILPLAILLLTGLFLWLQGQKKKELAIAIPQNQSEPKTVVKEAMNDVPVNPLSLTEEKLVAQDPHGFYEALNHELRSFLANKLQISLATINKKRIAEEADKKGIEVYTSVDIQQLLDDIEWQLYTPFAAEDKMQKMYDHANAIVHALNAT